MSNEDYTEGLDGTLRDDPPKTSPREAVSTKREKKKIFTIAVVAIIVLATLSFIFA